MNSAEPVRPFKRCIIQDMKTSISKQSTNEKSEGGEDCDYRFGARLRECRKNSGMTLAGLSEQARKLGGVDVSASGLHNLETGKTLKRPSRENLQGLAFALRL